MNQKNINQKASDEFLIVRLIPNVFTTVGMCIGLTGIRFAIECDWKSAVICVLIAAFFDLVDGLTARLLKATSRIGAELDSLSDAVSFGVTPTIILYLWVVSMTTDDNTYLLGWYWIPFIFYSSCCVLRLARFNIANRDLHKENLKSARNYFHGVPSPAAAISLLFPIILEINLVRFGYGESKNLPFIICIWVMIISLLMVSRIPTISLKSNRYKISYRKVIFVLIGVILTAAVIILEPWFSLAIAILIYLLTIPFSAIYIKKYNKDL